MLLGVSAAAAVALQQILRWISDTPLKDSNAITNENAIKVKSKIISCEKDPKKVDTNLEEAEKESTIINQNLEFIEHKMSAKMAPAKDEVSKNQIKIHQAPSVEKQSLKSWSELIEEDISQVRWKYNYIHLYK